MRTTRQRGFFLLATLGTLMGCTNVTDAPSTPSGQAAAAASIPGTGAVQITGLEQFKQTAFVLTGLCRNVKFETDRREVARAAINKALEGYAPALSGGLQVDVQSVSVRMRCHNDGAAGFQSYCAAETSLAISATGRDRSGQEVRVATSKDITERTYANILCVSTMPAVTNAVDKVLSEALVDMQSGLTSRTGLPPR